MTIPGITLVTSHGRQVLRGERRDTVRDVLDRYGIPWSGVSIYARGETGGVGSQVACLNAELGSLVGVAELSVYLNRNVNPLMFSLRSALVTPTGDGDPPVTEYAYQELDSAAGHPRTTFRELSAAECREIVSNRVADCLRASVPEGATIVVGVSGGGDSNALLHALSACSELALQIEPVILQGIPDWDSGLSRAQALCQRHGLPLTVIDSSEVADLLGMAGSGRPLVDCFEEAFPGDDFEFLGTLLIRLALGKRARELGTPYICTGLNFEDVLCEGLYRTATGMIPAGAPVRAIGDLKLLLPLWRCPKRILDGCFPTYSLANYQGRYPCFSLGRNLYYSVTYALQSQFPGYVEQLVAGMAAIGSSAAPEYVLDDELGFEVERATPLPLRRAFARMREVRASR